MPPPKPIACAMPASGPRLPEPMAFIMSAMFRCIFRSLLTSSTFWPAPAAMRFLRLALRMSGFLRSCARHRIDHRDLALEDPVVESRRPRSGSSSWRCRASCPSGRRCRPCSAICVSCSRMSSRSNWPLRIRSAVRAAFSASMFAAAFSTSDTTSPMPRMRPAMRLGMEIFQRVGLFAGADQLDRLAGDRAHRQRRAAAAVAVDAGQHDAGEADALVERAREIDRVLAGQRIGDQQHFMRIGGRFDLRRFRHHLFVERGAAGGVEQHDVVAAELAGLAARAWRSAAASGPATIGSVVDVEIAAEHGELLHRGRAIDVERGHQHLALVALRRGGGRASRWWWFCRSPAGRPS